MPIGNPLLATCDETGVVRVFEYAANVFSQIASRGGFSHVEVNVENGGMAAPYLQWLGNDDRLFVANAEDAGTARLHSLSPVLEDEVLATVGTPGFTRGEVHPSRIGRDIVFIGTNNGSNTLNATYAVRWEAGAFTFSATGAPIPYRNVRLRETTPNGELTLLRDNLGTYLFDLISTLDAKPLAFTAKGATAFDVVANIAKWSYNNRCVLVGDTSLNRVQNWRWLDNAWSLMHEVPLPAGSLQQIAMSPDNRFAAISVLDGGVYKTRIYNRAGDYFQTYQDLTGIGQMIDFSEDGKLLVDTRQRACFRLVGTDWQDHTSAMANIPVAIYSQTMSYGRTDAFGVARAYPNSLGELASGQVDLNDLKFTLLTSAGAFDPTDSVADFSAEVTTGRWPAGGLEMTGVVGTETPSGYSLAADDLTRIVFESAMTARYGLIYEVATGKPLVHIDFIQDRIVARNRAVTFEFRDGEFLKFST